jgi:hypothetical protein
VDLPRANPEIDRVWRIPHQDFSWFRGRAAVDGLILREVSESSGASPHRLVEIAVDNGDGIDSRDIDVRPVGAPAINERGILE